MNKKIRTAVIGIGFIGAAHIEAIRRLGYAEVVAICDPFEVKEKAEKCAIDTYYSDYKTMIDELDLDFVHVCTPNASHFPVASYAITKKVNVVLEKPMAISIEEGQELVRLAKENKVVAAVNFHNRFYPATLHLKEKISRNDLGKIISVSGCYVQDWLLLETDYSWRLESRISGTTRAVADIGSHWIDLAEYTTGLNVSEVMADFRTVYPVRKKAVGENLTFSNTKASTYDDIPIDSEDIAAILIRFDNGAIGCCFISQMFAGKKNRIHLMVGGTESSAEWNLENQEQLFLGYRHKANEVLLKDASLMDSSASSIIDYPAGHAEGFPDALKQAFNQVYQSHLKPDVNICYANFETGLREMKICDAIHRSAQQHKFIKIED